MPKIIYLHGFLSSPQSYKARLTKSWLAENKSDWEFECPYLKNPKQAIAYFNAQMPDWAISRPFFIGSSLGGLWAHYIAEKIEVKVVLINPSVKPHERFADWVGQRFKNYYNNDEVELCQQDMAYLKACESNTLGNSSRYLVLLQTGDEVLDYSIAAEKYRNAQLIVEQGGDHAFKGYDKWLPKIVDFYEGLSLNSKY